MSLKVTVRGTAFRAVGADRSGPFTMVGTFDPETNDVLIEKTYPWLLVVYSGYWDGALISGKWQIPGHDEGSFEMWPLDPDLAIPRNLEMLALPRSLSPALPARTD